MVPSTDSLKFLRSVFIAVAAPEFACSPIMYKQMLRFAVLPSPLWNHCTAVSFVIRGLFGGDYVAGRVKDEPHFWNRLPDGTEIDMTSCQYGGDGFNPLRKGRKVSLKQDAIEPLHVIAFGLKVKDEIARQGILQH